MAFFHTNSSMKYHGEDFFENKNTLFFNCSSAFAGGGALESLMLYKPSCADTRKVCDMTEGIHICWGWLFFKMADQGKCGRGCVVRKGNAPPPGDRLG